MLYKIEEFLITVLAAQRSQIRRFMFSNLGYRPTVYKTRLQRTSFCWSVLFVCLFQGWDGGTRADPGSPPPPLCLTDVSVFARDLISWSVLLTGYCGMQLGQAVPYTSPDSFDLGSLGGTTLSANVSTSSNTKPKL